MKILVGRIDPEIDRVKQTSTKRSAYAVHTINGLIEHNLPKIL
jgi:hypothetical protein